MSSAPGHISSNNYLYRMAGAVFWLYRNSKLEAMYPVYAIDQAKQKLHGLPRCPAVCAGPIAAGERVLVAHNV